MNTRRTLLLIFVLALVLRAGWVVVRWQTRGPQLEFPDEQIHWQLARNLATRGQLVTDDGRWASRMPGYPLFLLPFAWLGARGILAAQLAQAVLSAATAALAAAFVRSHAAARDSARGKVGTGEDGKGITAAGRGGQPPPAGHGADAGITLARRLALITGLLVAVDPYAIFFSALLLTEVLFTFEVVLLVVSAASWLQRPGRLSAAGVALCGTAAILTRPSAAGWVVLLWVMLLGFKRFHPAGWRLVAISALTLAAALVPWALRNRAVIGAPAWLSTNGGVTLYDAVGPQATGASDQSFLQRMPELAQMTEPQRDRYLYKRAIEQIRRDPLRIVRLAWVKFCRTWNPLPNAPGYRRSPRAWVLAAYTVVLLILAAVGVGFWRRCPATLALILLPIVYFTILHSIFIGSVRYRVPLMPLLAMLAAGGACVLLARRGRTAVA